MNLHSTLLSLACLSALATPALAGDTIIDYGTYQLHNHADGNQSPPEYGLRIDDFNGGSGKYTFSFDPMTGVSGSNAASMRLTYGNDGTSDYIVISGQVWGGLDSGGSYTNPALYDVYFRYDFVEKDSNDDDLIVLDDSDYVQSDGYIRAAGSSSTTANLWDFGGNHGYTFRLGDHDDDKGHRGHSGVSGWGWLNHEDKDTHVYSQDWLFTLDTNPVPLPSAAALGAFGLVLLARRRRRLSV